MIFQQNLGSVLLIYSHVNFGLGKTGSVFVPKSQFIKALKAGGNGKSVSPVHEPPGLPVGLGPSEHRGRGLAASRAPSYGSKFLSFLVLPISLFVLGQDSLGILSSVKALVLLFILSVLSTTR